MPGPAYRVETPRLIVRCWQPSDAPLVHAAIVESAKHLAPLPWGGEEPRTLEDRVTTLRRQRGEFDLGQNFVYGVFDRGETTVLGGTGLHPRVGPRALEIGYWIRAGSVGQGLAKEAAAAMAWVAFRVERVERLEIHCDPQNAPSAAVARRLGFRHEATLRRHYISAAGVIRDSMIWTLLPDEYQATEMAKMKIAAFDALHRPL